MAVESYGPPTPGVPMPRIPNLRVEIPGSTSRVLYVPRYEIPLLKAMFGETPATPPPAPPPPAKKPRPCP